MRVTKREEDIIEKMIDLSLSLSIDRSNSSRVDSSRRERARERDARMSVTFPQKKLCAFPLGDLHN